MSLKSGEKVNLLTLIQEIKSEEGKTDKTTTRQYPSDVEIIFLKKMEFCLLRRKTVKADGLPCSEIWTSK